MTKPGYAPMPRKTTLSETTIPCVKSTHTQIQSVHKHTQDLPLLHAGKQY